MKKLEYKAYITIPLFCFCISLICFIAFELYQLNADSWSYIGSFFKIFLCIITGALLSYKENLKSYNNPRCYVKKYTFYVVSLLAMLLIYYLIPEINYSLTNFLCHDWIMRADIPQILQFTDYLQLFAGYLISVSSIAAYIGCVISYFAVRCAKITKLYEKHAVI